ncbi:MAG: hypothetical protein JWO52_7055 [Gammaproteobacteria bacterium]|jgi:hypothetical protein|nr:hypothetical protein [Gammaproteobacteria bacterium]
MCPALGARRPPNPLKIGVQADDINVYRKRPIVIMVGDRRALERPECGRIRSKRELRIRKRGQTLVHN